MSYIELTQRDGLKISIRKDRIIAIYQVKPDNYDPDTGERVASNQEYNCNIEYEIGQRKDEIEVREDHHWIIAELSRY